MKEIPKIYLASDSPRRKELLSRVGIPFSHVGRANVDVNEIDNSNPGEYAKHLAILKAKAAITPGDGLILGFDTIVYFENHILEKPKSAMEARRFLSQMQNKWHCVYTGICVYNKVTEQLECEVEKTEVLFRNMSQKLIEAYVSTDEPLDKAGAYGIQEKGALLVKQIKGDYFNVVGLPLFSLTLLLNRFNIPTEQLVLL